jgi:hypothetical protein
MNHGNFRPLWVHRSFRAEEQARKRADCLFQAEIDHAFHYAGVKQAELWLEVHRLHAPMFANPSFETIYRELFSDLARHWTGQSLHVIGLGSGGGQKEAWLLEALRREACPLRYTPLDVSPELALLSAEVAAHQVNTEILPVVGDLAMLPEFKTWLDRYPKEELRLFTAFGLTPNFPPHQLFSGLREALRKQDQLLLSANLAPLTDDDDTELAYRAACERIRFQYDNPETRRWLRQILIDWGIAEYLSEPYFGLETLEGVDGFFARSHWLKETNFVWEGQSFQAQPGETLRLFFSLRFTPKRLTQCLSMYGLKLQEGRITSCGQEGVWRIEPC